MLKKIFLFIVIINLSTIIFANDNLNIESKKPIVISDKYYWTGSDGNIGIHITGKFNTLEKITDNFNFLKEIGIYKEKQWFLSDILVSVDFNANGYVVSWNVSGPKPLLLDYLKKLENTYKDKSCFYDFSYNYVNYKPTAYWENEQNLLYNKSEKENYIEIIELANSELTKINKIHKIDPDNYKIIEIKNMYLRGKGWVGPDFWQVTYKNKSAIPKTKDGILGAGGEIFIEVDEKNKKAKFMGFGE